MFLCALSFFPMTEECAASSTYQHVSPSSGECSPPAPTSPRCFPPLFFCWAFMWLQLSASLWPHSRVFLCRTRNSILWIRLTLARVRTPGGVKDSVWWLTAASWDWSNNAASKKGDVFRLFSGELKEAGPSLRLEARLLTGRIRPTPHWKVVEGSNSETQYPECMRTITDC